ncbi:hypothetical protein BaRGS_00004956 [Batillaria attramentaria]|uniref:Uncharacterized protein n=1 Tax=Batillaria attramentaria TaxID=370345 RepID=A0ABD0LXL2_9CAEN
MFGEGTSVTSLSFDRDIATATEMIMCSWCWPVSDNDLFEDVSYFTLIVRSSIAIDWRTVTPVVVVVKGGTLLQTTYEQQQPTFEPQFPDSPSHHLNPLCPQSSSISLANILDKNRQRKLLLVLTECHQSQEQPELWCSKTTIIQTPVPSLSVQPP